MLDQKPTVSTIIISYNTRDMTLDCLRALYTDLGDMPSEVWVVDNASSDGSVAAIRESYPKVLLIENKDNKGFGAANNQAMSQARGEFFLLLNSDAFPRPGAIAALVHHLQQHRGVGAVGPRLLNADGSLQVSCWKFPAPGRTWFESLGLAALLPSHPTFGDYYRWAHNEERPVDFIIGACILLRRQAYEQVGGFDEEFFLYAEETDWQKRMGDAGWSIMFTPSAEVTHLGGASGGTEQARVNRLFYDGQDRYIFKHFGKNGLMSMRAASALGCLIRLMVYGPQMLLPRRYAVARAKWHMMSRLLLRQVSLWRPEGRL